MWLYNRAPAASELPLIFRRFNGDAQGLKTRQITFFPRVLEPMRCQQCPLTMLFLGLFYRGSYLFPKDNQRAPD
jgi:hypothetical protein